jgi:hypothetical protein
MGEAPPAMQKAPRAVSERLRATARTAYRSALIEAQA